MHAYFSYCNVKTLLCRWNPAFFFYIGVSVGFYSKYTVDPWATWIWTTGVHFIVDFFFFRWVHGTGLGLGCRRCWKVDTAGQLLSCTQAGLHPSPHPTVVQGPAAILQWRRCIQTHVLNKSQSLCLFMFSPENKSAWMTAIVRLTQIPQESLL